MKIVYREKEWELEGSKTLKQAIEQVGLSHRRVLALRDGRVVHKDTVLEEDDEVKLIAVISGG